MATMDSNVIEDFSDLGQSFYFNYLGKSYVVPPISPFIAKRLIKISTEIGKNANKENIADNGIEKENIADNDIENVDLESISNNASEMFDNQCKFISESGIKQIVADNDINNYVAVTFEEIQKNWSTQLVIKVFEKINGIIFGNDKKIEEKKL